MPPRKANFELLRCLSMYLIVLGHSIMHGLRHVTETAVPESGFLPGTTTDLVNFCSAQYLSYLSNVGVNLFVLLTGYFLVNPKPVEAVLKKAFRLWKHIVFFTLLIYLAALALGWTTFSLSGLIGVFTPIYNRTYWFMTMYMALLLLSPFLSKLTASLDHREYSWFVAIFFVINFANDSIGYGAQYSGGMELLFFLFLFILGGYLRRFNPFPTLQRYGWAGYLGLNLLLCIASIALQFKSSPEFYYVKGIANNSFPILTATSLFMWFQQMDIREGRFQRLILAVSPYVLGVYLLHDHPLVRQHLWTTIDQWSHSPWLIPLLLVGAAGIFLAGIFVDKVRSSFMV